MTKNLTKLRDAEKIAATLMRKHTQRVRDAMRRQARAFEAQIADDCDFYGVVNFATTLDLTNTRTRNDDNR